MKKTVYLKDMYINNGWGIAVDNKIIAMFPFCVACANRVTHNLLLFHCLSPHTKSFYRSIIRYKLLQLVNVYMLHRVILIAW